MRHCFPVDYLCYHFAVHTLVMLISMIFAWMELVGKFRQAPAFAKITPVRTEVAAYYPYPSSAMVPTNYSLLSSVSRETLFALCDPSIVEGGEGAPMVPPSTIPGAEAISRGAEATKLGRGTGIK